MTDPIDWDAPAEPGSGLFGFEPALEDAELAILGVPWEPTVSYGRGTAATPGAIVGASHQVDLFDAEHGRSIGPEMAYIPPSAEADALNAAACRAAADGDAEAVNAASERLNAELLARTDALLGTGKRVAVLGGDHSAPLGAMIATAKQHTGLGILHIDAHHDLRVAYEGFEHSHASIMHNVLASADGVSALVSVGIRDFSQAEYERAAKDERIRTFYDRDLKADAFRGRRWADACSDIVGALPETVYVSFDIDGLEPTLCPGTGTPVPGGLGFSDALFLLEAVTSSGRTILGFDLCEVAGTEWDRNVAARLLHALACRTIFRSS